MGSCARRPPPRRTRRLLAAIDAKYKPLTPAGFPNADAYQMLAYCTAFGLDRGYLVYAKDAGEIDRSHEIRNAGMVIDVKAVNVEQLPEAVLDQVEELAAHIAGGIASAAPARGV